MFVNQKSQEITYALMRIAPYIRRIELRHRIERLSLQILEEVGLQNYETALRTASVLESFINLGKAMYEIEPVNANVIIGELKTLGDSLAQLSGLENASETAPNLSPVFSKVPAVIPEERGEALQPDRSAPTATDEMNAGNGSGNGLASTIRQSAILERIRQAENRQIQLKEILAAFPEVSERTMRYDLQKMCSQGVIERVGNGGPGSYYTLKS